VALVLGAAGALGGAVRVDPAKIGSLVAAVGAAGVVIVLAHVVNKPGPSGAMGDAVHLASGLWIALGGCAAVVAGGLMAAAPPSASRAPAPSAMAFPSLDPELPPVFTPAPGTGAASVPPPGAVR
jgi:hypothetical protein